MKTILKLLLIFFSIGFISCKSDIIFDSFLPLNQSKIFSNTSKIENGYYDNDSNIIFPLTQDTLQIHFDVIKNRNYALIFSLNKIDTVGNLSFNKQTVYFKPKGEDTNYKLFDFKANSGDSLTIQHCGLLTNDILIVDSTKNVGNEILQFINVIDNSPFPNLRQAKIKNFVVSSKYGIEEMEIYIGWSVEKNIKIKNTP